MNARKVMAVTLAAAMVAGSSMTVFAENTTSTNSTYTGSGSVEGYVTEDVFNVTLPTSLSMTFILDPQGLIAATDAEAYSGADFEEGATLYFANTETTTDADSGETTTSVTGYSSVSDTYSVTNKSSYGVDVMVEATLSSYDGISISTDGTFSGATAAIYMALVDESGAQGLSSTEGKATLSGYAYKAPDEAYEVTYTSGNPGTYAYSLVSDTTGIDFDTYEFYLTGACNADGDWSSLISVTPSLSVVWTVTKSTAEEPSITPSTVTVTSALSEGENLEFTLSLGSGVLAATDVTGVTFVNAAGKTVSCDETDYSYSEGTLKLLVAQVNAFYNSAQTSRTYTITLDTGDELTVTLTK